MKKQWFCVSCVSEIELDTHGRCSTCGSDAVERIAQRAMVMIQQENDRPGDQRTSVAPAS